MSTWARNTAMVVNGGRSRMSEGTYWDCEWERCYPHRSISCKSYTRPYASSSIGSKSGSSRGSVYPPYRGRLLSNSAAWSIAALFADPKPRTSLALSLCSSFASLVALLTIL